MKLWRVNCFTGRKNRLCLIVSTGLLLLAHAVAAQSGTAGIEQANTNVRGFFPAGANLMYAIGGVVGLIGAVKVYQKWNTGDPDTGRVAAAWFGSCIFLVIVATVIKSFFGL